MGNGVQFVDLRVQTTVSVIRLGARAAHLWRSGTAPPRLPLPSPRSHGSPALTLDSRYVLETKY